MSAIDTINNVHIANFCNFASVYWILEPCKRDVLVYDIYKPKSPRMIDSNYISIGGGSGEHKSLLINIDHAVYSLFDDRLDYISNPEWYIDTNEWDYDSFKRTEAVFKNNNVDLIQRILNSVGFLVLSELRLESCIKNKEILNIAQKFIKDWDSRLLNSDLCVEDDYIGFNGLMYSETYGKITMDNKTIFKYSLSDWYRDNPKNKEED